MNTRRWLGIGLLSLALLGVTGGRMMGSFDASAANQNSTFTWSCTGWSGSSGGMMDGNWGDWNDMGPGMMSDGNAGGMMSGGNASGNMWGTMGTMGMMGSYAASSQPITLDEAGQKLATFVKGCDIGVTVGEIMPFASNYYAQLLDANGNGYAEVLVDRFTGAVYPEPGPGMMWNSRWSSNTGTAKYDQAAAKDLATTFLGTYLSGATVLDGTGFPGYFTFDFGRGQVEGMLSVSATTGDIWVHTWHGPALAMGH